MKQIKLNLGCGSNKIKGYINIDCEKQVKPDLLHDFTKKPLPYKNETVSEIVMFHTIEHIQKIYHRQLFGEFFRVLKKGGKLIISYPNFAECAARWIHNVNGQRDFWEATIYGRQLYPSDYHVALMDPTQLQEVLFECGFNNIKHAAEKQEAYYCITYATRGAAAIKSYEQHIAEDIQTTHFARI